jgi:hypothetical protein
MMPGGTYEFGIAFWDPYESDADGWSDAGHYVTGCTEDWIEMELVASSGGGGGSPSAPVEGPTAAPGGETTTTSDASPRHALKSVLVLAAVVFAFA